MVLKAASVVGWGTIVEVAGEVTPNTSDAKLDAAEPFFLSITTVDGRQLTKPAMYPFIEQAKLKNVSPKVGEKFHFVGFETGRFDGSPAGEFRYVDSYASTRYHFATQFVVLAAK